MKKKLLSVILSLSMILGSLVFAPVSSYAYDEAQTLLSNVAAWEWMSVIRDDTKLTEITIPGTHDSCARKFHNEDPFGVTSGISKCQNLTIREQLDAGVRFLDVRCEVDASSHSVKTVHGSTDCWNGDDYYYLDYCFRDVYNFLAEHPSETVLISIKEDDGGNGVPHFTNAVYEYIHGYRSQDNYYFYGTDYNYNDHWYLGKSVPTLESVRGKCVLFNRFDQYIANESGQGVTVNENESGQKIKYNDMEGSFAEPYYANITSYNTGIGTAHIQDYYKWSTDQKKTATQYMLSLGHYHGEYYINYSSTVSDSSIPNPQNLAKTVNAQYPYYTYEKTKPSGIFAMDFATEDLCRYIIKNNEGVCTVVDGWDGNVYYNLNRKTGVLTISGTGAMNNYAYSSSKGANGAGSTAPWGDQNKNALYEGQYNSDLITSVVIGEGITSIGNYAFYGYDHLNSVTIPSSVKSIGEGAFTKCSALTSFDISSKYITSIGNMAFKDCTGLTSFTTSDKLTSIGTNAFQNCSSLTMYGKAGIYSQTYANDNSITYVASGEYNADINWFTSRATYYEPFTADGGGTLVTNRRDNGYDVEWRSTETQGSVERKGVVHFPYCLGSAQNYVNTGKSALGGNTSINDGVTVSFYRAINGNYWGSGTCVTLAKDSNNYLALNDDGTFIYKRNGSTRAECTSKTFTRTGNSEDTHKWEYFTYSITDSTVKVYLNGEFVHQASGTSGLVSFLESETTLVYPGSRYGNGTCTLELDEISILPIAIDDIEAAAMCSTYTAPIIYESNQRPADANVRIYASNGYENVIYTHGTNGNTSTTGIKDAADYMFKGDLVADGDNDSAYVSSDTTALEGELYTTVTINSKYSIWLNTAYDNYGNTLTATQISDTNGRKTFRLSGSLSRGYADGGDDDIELSMYLTDGNNLIPETKYVHVTQHPVSAHAMAGIYRNWDNKTRDISIIFRADGSTGVSNTYYSGNYSYLHTPVCVNNAWRFANNYNADTFFVVGDGRMGNDSNDSFPNTTNGADIVNAGVYSQVQSGSGTVYTGEATTAHYYIDKSVLTANKTVGGVHLDGDGNTYHMNSVITRLGAGGSESNYWWRNCWVYGQDGLGWNLTSDNAVAESIGHVDTYDTNSEQKFGYTMPTITGYLDRGSSTYPTQFSVGINHSGDEYCAQPRVDYNVHIFDKSTLRNLVESYEAENLTGAWTSHEEWEAYLKALSDAYAILNDYKDTTCPDANSTVYKNLVAAHRAITYTDRTAYETARSTIVSALPRNVLYERNTFERVFDFMHTELNNQESYDIHAGKIYFNLRFVEQLELGDSLSRIEAAADSKSSDAVQYDLDAIDDIKDEFYDAVCISETVDGTKYTYYAYYSQDSYDSLVSDTIDEINNAYMHYSINTNSGNVVKEAENPFAGKDLSDGFTISFSKYCAYDADWNTSLINFSTGNQSDNRYFIIMANGIILFNDGNGGAGGWNNCYFDATGNDYTNTTEAAWHDIDLVFYKNPSGDHMLAYYTDGMLSDRYDLSSIAASGYPRGVSSGNDGIFSFVADENINLYYGASFTIYGTMAGTTECYIDKVDFCDSPVFPVERSTSVATNDTRYINDFTDSLGGDAHTGNVDNGNSTHLEGGDHYGRTGTAFFPWSYDAADKNYVSTNASPFAYTYSGNGYSISYYQRINGNYWEDTQSVTFAQGETGEHKYLAIGTDGKIHYNNGNGGSDSNLSGAKLFYDYTTKCNSVVKQTWQHITVSFIDDFHIKYYVNGVLAANITVSGTDEYNAAGGMMDFIKSAGTKLYLGCYCPYWGTCSLSLDNVKCFNHALSEGEAAALYSYETSGAPAPIYSNSFDEDIPEVLSGAAEWKGSLSGRSGLLHIMNGSADGNVDIYVDGVLTGDTSNIVYGSEVRAVYTGSSNPYGWDRKSVNSTGTTNTSVDTAECTFTLTGNSSLKYFAKDETVDLSKLQAAYDNANEILLELDGKTARYTNASLTELTESINATVREYLSANKRTVAGYPMSVETAANSLADEINNAVKGLKEPEENIDLSVFQKLIETVEKADDDIYSFDDEYREYLQRIAGDLDGSNISYESIEGENSSITAVKTSATQSEIDDVNTTISTGLSTKIKQYDIKLKQGTLKENDGVSFNNATSSYDAGNDKYRATYSSKLNLKADEETAWFMDFSTNTMSRTIQYQGFGKQFSTKVLGNINIYAHQRSEATPYKLTITRRYDNNENKPVQLIDFVSSTYTLPSAPAIANYRFDGYTVGNETKQPTNEISISGDTEITAVYTFNGEANCAVSATPLENGTGFSNSVAYNTRIVLKGGDNAYGWVELIKDGKGTSWRPFYIGANLVYYATESITLKAVTKAEFDAYAFSIPAINIKQSDAILSSGKTIFNGQLVYNNFDDIIEYGILVAGSTNPEYELDERDVILENSGVNTDFTVRRCKSTKLVGANQFTISVGSLSGEIVYRGYIIHNTSNGLITEYTDIAVQTI